MTLTVGTRLGPYEVIAALGSGGMGEVYRARDSKLNRDVALKILPEASAADPERLARFKREAQVLASLNHPHIAAIYGFEDSGSVQALVLELIEGQTLSDRIADGPIPINEALSVASQIAEALEAAREQGVIHRDLKPDNIKLRANGTVKVLDFGLAKLAQRSDSGLQAADTSQSPTITSPAPTRLGVIMGTAAYMSPEQARGLPVDKQTDIWAFGCVLYEMLSGRPAFVGETFSDTIVRILEHEPDWQALPASTPARIRELLRRCLQKGQERRLHDIADARVEIEEARTALNVPRRIVRLPVVAAGVALGLALMAGAWWYAWRSTAPVQHEPVSILIADFQNRTNDPTFDRTLEPVLRIVLEEATFISAYDRSIINRIGATAPDSLDERAAQEIAVMQGVGVVLSGSIDRQGSGYTLSLSATQPVTGNVISRVEDTASDKSQVLAAATGLAHAVREALGDDTSDYARRFAMETLTATSLEAVHDYAVAQEALSNNRWEEARNSYRKAVERDPNFAAAYSGMAITSRNMGLLQDAEKYAREAVRHLDRLSERERYRARGLLYYLTSDYQACVKEYGDLVERYAGDVAARNNLALCLTYLREMSRARDEMQRAVKILPRRALYRYNLALYSAYGGDFQTSEQEARTAMELGSSLGRVALAFAQLGQNRLPQATATYQELAKGDAMAASYAASGLGDLAVYEGRFSQAARLLELGAAADLKAENVDRAAAKFVALARARISRRETAAASTAADSALEHSTGLKIRFLAARIFVEAGQIAKAQSLAEELASEAQAEPQVLAKIIEAGIALKNGERPEAIKVLTQANSLLDTWIGRFDLGRAYLEAGLLLQADSEFDACLKRRGEALSLFLDEEPTYGFLPAVYYYQGLVRERLKGDGVGDSYRNYLSIRGKSNEDPLVAEIRNRGRE